MSVFQARPPCPGYVVVAGRTVDSLFSMPPIEATHMVEPVLSSMNHE